MKKIFLLFAIFFFLTPVFSQTLEEDLRSVKNTFLNFPVQKITFEEFQGSLHKAKIFFNYPETKPFEVTAAFTEKYACVLDEMNSTDFMVCYRMSDGNLAIFSLGASFTLEIIFSDLDEEKYQKTKPLIE